ncbi:MAG: peptide chain release factor 2 [Candidatus Omnitrophica bacterium]|nr:peptide chain release factor 2 [Candidatus Omnitrophota bacterium]
MNELKEKISYLKRELVSIRELLRIEEKRGKMSQLQLKMSDPDFWQDPQSAAKVVEELKHIKNDVEQWDRTFGRVQEAEELCALDDSSLQQGIQTEVDQLEREVRQIRLGILFSGKFDHGNAIVEINSGAGGTEACDWAHMLFRMYFRWAEQKQFKVKVLNEVRGEEAGVKNVTFLVQGTRAYGLLKSERGVHRLVRISPFDSNKRRHTSFASVDVLPEIQEEIEIEINPDDLKIDTFRSSGKGGQHVNVTDSAVRITHLPTGIVVGCQNERSQHQNKHTAMSVLKAKLYERKEQEQKKELETISGEKQKIEWGSQIRSYVLHPYLMVKDHRTHVDVGNANGVLDGNIDDFIFAYLEKIHS